MLGIIKRGKDMKKLIVILVLATIGQTIEATEFKGQTYSSPRIAGETPQPNAYQYYTPTQDSIKEDPFVVIPTTGSLRVPKLLENESPDPQNIVFDSPAMTRK